MRDLNGIRNCSSVGLTPGALFVAEFSFRPRKRTTNTAAKTGALSTPAAFLTAAANAAASEAADGTSTAAGSSGSRTTAAATTTANAV